MNPRFPRLIAAVDAFTGDVQRRPLLSFGALFLLGVFLFLRLGIAHRMRQLEPREHIVVPVGRGASPARSSPLARVVRGPDGWRFEACADGVCADRGRTLAVGDRIYRLDRLRCGDGICRAVPEGDPAGQWAIRAAGISVRCQESEPERVVSIPGIAERGVDGRWSSMRVRCDHGVPTLHVLHADGVTWRFREGAEPECSGSRLFQSGSAIPRGATLLDLCTARGRHRWTMRVEAVIDAHRFEWDTARDGTGLADWGVVRLRDAVPGYELMDERTTPHAFIAQRFLGRDVREGIDRLLSERLLQLDQSPEGPRLVLINPLLDAHGDWSEQARRAWRDARGVSLLRRRIRDVNLLLARGRFDEAMDREFEFEQGVRLWRDPASSGTQREHWRADLAPIAIVGLRWNQFERDLAPGAEAPAARRRPTLVSAPAARRAVEHGDGLVLQVSMGGRVKLVVEGPREIALSGGTQRPPNPGVAGSGWRTVGLPLAVTRGTLVARARDNRSVIVVGAGAARASLHLQVRDDALAAVWTCEAPSCARLADTGTVNIGPTGAMQIGGGSASGSVARIQRGAIPFEVPFEEPPAVLQGGEELLFESLHTRIRVATSHAVLAAGSTYGASRSGDERTYPLGELAGAIVGGAHQALSLDRVITERVRDVEQVEVELDADLQRRVQLRLEAAERLVAAAVRPPPRPRQSFAVVLDAEDGSVLAAASTSPMRRADPAAGEPVAPQFFTRWSRSGGRAQAGASVTLDRERVAEILRSAESDVAPGERVLGRVFQNGHHPIFEGAYLPGSTFKPIVAMLAADSTSPTPLPTRSSCIASAADPSPHRGHGAISFPPRDARDAWLHCHGAHEHPTLIEAISRSCDLYFARLALSSIREDAPRVSEFDARFQPIDQGGGWFLHALSGRLGLTALLRESGVGPRASACRELATTLREVVPSAATDLALPELAPGLPMVPGSYEIESRAGAAGARPVCEVDLRQFGPLGFGQRVWLNPLLLAALYGRIARDDAQWAPPRLRRGAAELLPWPGSPEVLASVRRGMEAVLRTGTLCRLLTGGDEAHADLQAALRDATERLGVDVIAKTGTAQEEHPDATWVHKLVAFVTRPRTGASIAHRFVVLVSLDLMRIDDGVGDADETATRAAVGILRDVADLYADTAPTASSATAPRSRARPARCTAEPAPPSSPPRARQQPRRSSHGR